MVAAARSGTSAAWRSAVVFRWGIATLVLLAAARLWLAIELPLLDTTEARYAEFARKMAETGDWLVPQFDYGVPYLGKPPMTFWLAALGISRLGATELGARLPFLLVSGLFGVAFYRWLRASVGAADAVAAVLLLVSAPIVFLCSGAVMADVLLSVCTSGALMCFWTRVHGGGRAAEVLLFLLAGAGLLVKGPLALVLIALPMLGWSLTGAKLAQLRSQLAWIRGLALVALVALPWYVLAERRNPGFLAYFIGGENLGRFLSPGWSGDRYGWAHDEPYGTVWLYFLLGTCPWSLAVLAQLATRRDELRRRWRAQRERLSFALWWTLTPLVLFTFSANITAPYVLPAVPGAVVAGVTLLGRTGPAPAHSPALARASWMSGAMLAVFVALAAAAQSSIAAHSQKAFVETVLEQRPPAGALLYWRHRYFSAEYYSAGRARVVRDPDAVRSLLSEHRSFVLVIEKRRVAELPADLRSALATAAENDEFYLLSPVVADAS